MSMNTITLDCSIYNSVASTRPKYYINPKVKALEMGSQCPDDLSLGYKKEQVGILEEKYL